MAKLKIKVLKKSTRQTGKSDMSRDILLKAKAPGKRVSKSGKIYYEYRKNRTDVKGRDTPRKTKVIKKKLKTKNIIRKFITIYGKVKKVSNFGENYGYSIIINKKKKTIKYWANIKSWRGAIIPRYTYKLINNELISKDFGASNIKNYKGVSYVKYSNNDKKYNNDKIKNSELFKFVSKILLNGGKLR